jgi:hypothetical protein
MVSQQRIAIARSPDPRRTGATPLGGPPESASRSTLASVSPWGQASASCGTATRSGRGSGSGGPACRRMFTTTPSAPTRTTITTAMVTSTFLDVSRPSRRCGRADQDAAPAGATGVARTPVGTTRFEVGLVDRHAGTVGHPPRAPLPRFRGPCRPGAVCEGTDRRFDDYRGVHSGRWESARRAVRTCCRRSYGGLACVCRR